MSAPEPQGAVAAASDDYLAELAAVVRARLDAIVAGREPKPVPPVPIAIRWRTVRLGSVELGAPLVALAGADLDGDGIGELYAVTEREVVVLGFRAGRPTELG